MFFFKLTSPNPSVGMMLVLANFQDVAQRFYLEVNIFRSGNFLKKIDLVKIKSVFYNSFGPESLVSESENQNSL